MMNFPEPLAGLLCNQGDCPGFKQAASGKALATLNLRAHLSGTLGLIELAASAGPSDQVHQEA